MISARIMLFIAVVNFLNLLITGKARGGKVMLENNFTTMAIYYLLIIVLFYLSFYKKQSQKYKWIC